MNRPSYMPLADAMFLAWLENFCAKFLLHAATLNLAAEITSITNDLLHTRFVILNTDSQRQRMSDIVTMKNTLLDGDLGPTALAFPGPAALIGLTPPPVGAPPGTLGTVPTAVPAGVVARIAGTVGRVLSAINYTPGIGQDLNIVKGALPSVNLPGVKAKLEVKLSGLKPLVKWTRERGTDALRIEADYATGSYVRATDDTRPDFLDDHALPAAGQSAIWKYRAIYLKDGQPVGLYSEEYSINVAGM